MYKLSYVLSFVSYIKYFSLLDWFTLVLSFAMPILIPYSSFCFVNLAASSCRWPIPRNTKQCRLAHKSSFWARSCRVLPDQTRKPSERLWESLEAMFLRNILILSSLDQMTFKPPFFDGDTWYRSILSWYGSRHDEIHTTLKFTTGRKFRFLVSL